MLPFRIALRYLFAPKSHRAVNVISVISIAGVAVATMAIVVVLSVFNGFTSLAGDRLGRIDPDLKVVPLEGKAFAQADSLAAAIAALDGVASAMPVLAERALLVAPDHQQPVRLIGIDPVEYGAEGIDSMLIDGVYATHAVIGPDTIAAVQLSVGVALNSRLRPGDDSRASVYVPRRVGRINPANPAAAYRNMPVVVSGVFQIDQPEYDNDCVFVPLDPLRRLLEYTGDEASSIDISVASGARLPAVQAAVESIAGAAFAVLTRDRQQADTFRMIAIEKWVTFLMMVFILLIASFNIVSTLSLLVIEKRDNMLTLRALGASQGAVRAVFAWLACLITAAGGVVGAVLGVGLSLLQEHFGLIKLDGDPSALSVDAYPVHLEWGDVGLVLVTVVAVGVAIAALTRIFTRKINTL